MSNIEDSLNHFRETYEQEMLASMFWFNLAAANAGKAILGRIYEANLGDHLKEYQMPGHNDLAAKSALVAVAGFIVNAEAAESTAAATRIHAAAYRMPVPSWAVRRSPWEYE